MRDTCGFILSRTTSAEDTGVLQAAEGSRSIPLGATQTLGLASQARDVVRTGTGGQAATPAVGEER